ncbi:MAG: arylsulfatase [Bacteroidota bacterium]
MKIYILLIYFSIFALFTTCSQEQKQIKPNHILIEQTIKEADVIRTSFPAPGMVKLYQGNGLFGSSYGPLGLHVNPSNKEEYKRFGKTEFLHIKYYTRAKHGADYLIPFGQVFWEKEPEEITSYSQHQSFLEGNIRTQFGNENGNVSVLTWFDPVEKNIAGISINVEGESSDVIFKSTEVLNVHYNQELHQTTEISENSGEWKIEVSCNEAKLVYYIKTNTEVTNQNSNLRFKLHSGENNILLSLDKPTSSTLEKSLTQTTDWWQKKWQEMGIIIVPDPNAQKVWVRSMAMFLYSFNDEKLSLPPPMGFTSNHWPFGFPQDVSFVHPILLATGNIGIAKSMVENFTDRLSGMKEYTKRLLNVDGIMAPWVFPYGEFSGFHTPTPPNRHYYQIHNSGYMARMAYETALLANDDNWRAKYAEPLIRETAQFYKSICQKRDDSLWHLSIKPSQGQDEKGGVNQENYLCALFSAKYCFQKAIEYGLDKDGTYSKILKDGLAFPTLESKRGYYFSSGGSGEDGFGEQKHPVQLNDMAFLPVSNEVSNASEIAYDLRYSITKDAKKPYFYGWSLGEFLLAGSRIGDTEGWKKDWENMEKANYVDPDWIQIYETSGKRRKTFYNITNGLVAQSLLNNLVSDWFGKLEIAKCNPWGEQVYLNNIYSQLGVKISGEIVKNSASLELEAWKDCEFEIHGERIKLKKNEIIRKEIKGYKQQEKVAAKKDPNIIFILVDDMAYRDIGAFGQKKIQTPSIDKMAKEGMIFTNAYSGNAVCAPSRSSLMQGLHPGHARVRDNEYNDYREGLLEGDYTVAMMLKQAGYKTGLFGKWGLALHNQYGIPNRMGFDEFYGYLNQRHAHCHYPEFLYHNEERIYFPENGTHHIRKNYKANQPYNENGICQPVGIEDPSKATYAFDWYSEKSLDFVRQNKDHPFFLYLAYTPPHGSYIVPDLGEYTNNDWPLDHKVYAAMISRVDSQVGKLMSLLKELNIDENTLIVFASDNGTTKGNVPRGDNTTLEFFENGSPRAGLKGNMLDGAFHVPGIARWPEKIDAGQTSNHIWAMWDFLPTAADIIGIQAPVKTDGISILPTLLGEKEKQQKHDFLYWEFKAEQAVRFGKWYGYKNKEGKLEIYDLEKNPAQDKDLSAEFPEIAQRINGIMMAEHTPSNAFPSPQESDKEFALRMKKQGIPERPINIDEF